MVEKNILVIDEMTGDKTGNVNVHDYRKAVVGLIILGAVVVAVIVAAILIL